MNHFNRFCMVALLVTLALPALGESPVAEGAQLEKISGGFAFTEGPAVDKQGNVYFTDQPNNRIVKWHAKNGKLEFWMEPSGRANGLCFDKDGFLWACADEKNELWKIAPDKTVQRVLSTFEGKLINAPNDVWVAPDGGLYFSDPFFQRDWWTRGPQEQPVEGVYYLAPDHKTIKRVIDDFETPNGLIGSADGKLLYVTDPGAKKTWRYDIAENGSLKNKQLFCELGSDGMTLDSEGNVYLTGEGVIIFNAGGERIAHIEVPEKWTANVSFGGKDRDMLFITASEGLYCMKMRTQGVGSQ